MRESKRRQVVLLDDPEKHLDAFYDPLNNESEDQLRK